MGCNARPALRPLLRPRLHGRSRNRIYAGMFLLYLGIGLAALSAWMALIFVPLAIIMRYGVVARGGVP